MIKNNWQWDSKYEQMLSTCPIILAPAIRGGKYLRALSTYRFPIARADKTFMPHPLVWSGLATDHCCQIGSRNPSNWFFGLPSYFLGYPQECVAQSSELWFWIKVYQRIQKFAAQIKTKIQLFSKVSCSNVIQWIVFMNSIHEEVY